MIMLNFEEIGRITAEEGAMLKNEFGDDLSFLILRKRDEKLEKNDISETIYGKELSNFVRTYHEFCVGNVDFLSKEGVNKYNFSPEIPWFEDKKLQENMLIFAVSDPYYFTVDIASGFIYKNLPGSVFKTKVASSLNLLLWLLQPSP